MVGAALSPGRLEVRVEGLGIQDLSFQVFEFRVPRSQRFSSKEGLSETQIWGSAPSSRLFCRQSRDPGALYQQEI